MCVCAAFGLTVTTCSVWPVWGGHRASVADSRTRASRQSSQRARRGVSQHRYTSATWSQSSSCHSPTQNTSHTSPKRSFFSLLLNSFKCNLVETFAEINLHVLRLMKQKIKTFIFLFVCYSIVLYLISKCIFCFTIISIFYIDIFVTSFTVTNALRVFFLRNYF